MMYGPEPLQAATFLLLGYELDLQALVHVMQPILQWRTPDKTKIIKSKRLFCSSCITGWWHNMQLEAGSPAGRHIRATLGWMGPLGGYRLRD